MPVTVTVMVRPAALVVDDVEVTEVDVSDVAVVAAAVGEVEVTEDVVSDDDAVAAAVLDADEALDVLPLVHAPSGSSAASRRKVLVEVAHMVAPSVADKRPGAAWARCVAAGYPGPTAEPQRLCMFSLLSAIHAVPRLRIACVRRGSRSALPDRLQGAH